MALTFALTNTDIDFEKRQEIISSVQDTLYEQAEYGIKNMIEADEKFAKEDANYKRKYMGMSWQEVYCREYAIQYICWEKEEDAKEFDWDFAVRDYFETQAENALNMALKNIELEVHF